MSIRGLHPVVDLLGASAQPARVENFVWVYFAQVGSDSSMWGSTAFPEQRCQELLTARPDVLQHLQGVLNHSWLPERDLCWLNDSNRQVFWVQRYIAGAMQAWRDLDVGKNAPLLNEQQIPHHLCGASRTTALVDYWASCSVVDMNIRREAVLQAERGWNRQLRTDRRFDWLQGADGAGRRARFWERLISHLGLPLDQMPVPEGHDWLLNAIDRLGAHPDAVTLFNQKARKDFQQQQRRANNANRSQCNFELEAATVAKLKALARKYDISQAAVIELLVREESERPFHIPEKLRRTRELLGPT